MKFFVPLSRKKVEAKPIRSSLWLGFFAYFLFKKVGYHFRIFESRLYSTKVRPPETRQRRRLNGTTESGM